MSLTSSMWTSVSGLLAHGDKMGVIGNNISNINTLGFKSSRMDFQDFMSEDVGTSGGVGQVGRGVSIGTIMNNFKQGAVETASDATDMAITDNGFFSVRPPNDSIKYFTRAGNFRFDKDGYLVDPNKNILQGWKIDNSTRTNVSTTGGSAEGNSGLKGTGVPVDIRMDSFTCDPKATSKFTMAVNLDSGQGNDKNVDPDNPFFSMLTSWDARPDAKGDVTPLAQGTYAWSDTIEVYDEGGQMHKLTVYFDRVTQTNATNIENLKNNEIVWEYVVTMDPSEDLRNFSNNPADVLPDKYKGLLMSGTVTFGKDGQLRDTTAYVPTKNDMSDLSSWVQAPLSSTGYPMLAPNFSGTDGASNPWNMDVTPPEINRNVDGHLVEFDLGLHNGNREWDPAMPATIADWSSKVTTGGYQNVYKTRKDASGNIEYFQKSTSTTAPKDYPKTTPVPDGLPAIPNYQPFQPNNPGEVADTTGLIYLQKAVSQGLRTGEAAGRTAGKEAWVYSQASGAMTADASISGYLYFNKNNASEVYVQKDNLYYLQTAAAGTPGKTLEELKTAGVDLQANPDETKPISTRTPSYSDVPKFILDNQGFPIQATETALYPGMGAGAEIENTRSTSYTKSGSGNQFYEYSRRQDGYTYGDFRYVTVSRDGVLSASYSNGVSLELYQVTLYDFPSKQNLRREGSNLFSETRESGLSTSGAAGSGGFGAISGNALEQSNVDLSNEFVQMITTQKGFQANSKNITTVDTMLDTVINMKR